MNTALNAALSYAGRGWHVFPVHPPPNKRPLCQHGFKDATTDHATIVGWWTQWPSAQVGVACGASNLVSVDLDEKPVDGEPRSSRNPGWISGTGSLIALGVDPDICNLLMATPRNNGRQLLYDADGARIRRQLGVLPGIDLLGDGGYTIMPSPASPGRDWLTGDPLDPYDLDPVPDWLIALAGLQANDLRGPKDALEAHPTPKGGHLGDDQVADIRAALTHIPNEDRGIWIQIGMALKSSGAGDQAYALWEEWSESSGKFDEQDQRYQWQRLKTLRMDGSEMISLSTLFYLAKQHGYQEQATVDIRVGPPGGPKRTEEGLEGPKKDFERTDLSRGHSGDIPQMSPSDAPLIERPQVELSDWEDVAELPPIEWQVEGLIPRAALTVLAGDTEAGKSFCLIDMAMRLVHGLPFAGLPVEAGSVIYLAGEGQAGMAARFRAWRRHHQHLDLDAGDRYCVVSSEIPVLNKGSMHVLHELVTKVVEWKGHPPSMIIIDTLSQGLEDDENESRVVAPVIRGLMALRSRWRASIALAHHLVKLQAKGRRKGESAPRATRDSIRGSGALTRNIDTVLGLIADENDGPRELCVWKQKDGSKVEPINLWLHPVPTGRQRAGGEDEWSCIMVPDGCARILEDAKVPTPVVEDPTAPNPMAIAAHKAAIEKIVATLVELGAIDGGSGAMSGNEICAASGIKRGVTLAAIKGAAREGLIVNEGTDRAARWLVPKSSGTTNGQVDK